MTQKEIIQNNRLIAEYIGWKFIEENETVQAYYNNTLEWVDTPVFLNNIFLKGFTFHSNWEKLTPVLELIRETREINIYIQSYSQLNICTIYSREDMFEHRGHSNYTQGEEIITAVYIAVVEYIKWLNHNLKPD
jgi:hypothetical protein